MSPAYAYVDTPNANLVCCICRSPFVDPCTTRTCCHTFCYECIARAVGVNHQCPIDRCPLSVHDLASADPVVRNLVDELVVECPQRSNGCTYTCQRLLLTAHLKDLCAFVEVPCPEGKCEQRILRKDVSQHMHAVSESEVSTEAESQPETSGETAAETAPPPRSPQPAAEDALVTENALLRLRLLALEGIVNAMRQEMQAVQRALGPWYRPDDAGVQSTAPLVNNHSSSVLSQGPIAFEVGTHQQTQGQPSEPGASTAPLDTLYASAQPSHTSVVPGHTTGESADVDIASYFPPVEDDTPDVYATPESSAPWHAPSNPHARNHTPTPSTTQRTPPLPPQAPPNAQAGPSNAFLSPTYPAYPLSYGACAPFGPAFSYALPPPAFSPPDLTVPPLDPTMPLPATLAALHGTLSTLAGTVGALAAARGVEALHTSEELRGMRATMHGLRMQLHDVLTALSTRDSSAISNGSGVSTASESTGVPYGPGTAMPPWLAYPPRAFGAYMPMHPKPPLPPSVTKL